jgi:2-methylisocitrate lyase-like PEP mutase family enzyme
MDDSRIAAGTPASKLRRLIAEPGSQLVVSSYDPMSARIAEAAGFPVLHLSGYCAAASYAGLPDVGLLTLTEIVDTCRRICEVTSRPVFADADTGYGGLTNVRRTIRLFESAGAAGVHLEDQADPKRCGHMAGKLLVSSELMCAKIETALEARRDDDFVVVARTDAIAVDGLDAALERAVAYCDAGADMILVDAPESVEDVERIARELQVPLMFDWAHGGATPPISRAHLEELGYKLIVFPDIIHVVHRSLDQFHRAVLEADTLVDVEAAFTSFEDFNAFLDLEFWTTVDDRGREAQSA